MKTRLPFVSIIVVNHNGNKFLKGCFDSLCSLSYPASKIEIIMVDNCSQDNSVAYVRKEYPRIKIIKNDVNNYCKANNLGVERAKGKYVALLNNDTRVDKNWLSELIKVIETNESIGGVGSKILFEDGSIESVGHRELPNYYWTDRGCDEKDQGQYDKLEEIDSICGCSVLYRRIALRDINGFDEDFNMYLEDVDMSIRLKKEGWKFVYVPGSLVYHRHHGTAREDFALSYTERNRLLLVAKHYPKKLNNALLGKGYFTAKNDISMQSSLYKLLPTLILKLIKHHNIGTVEGVLNELCDELKRISNYENIALVDKINDKDTCIHSLNTEVVERKKEISDIYNSTAFKFIVRPLWTVLWRIKLIFRSRRIFKISSNESIEQQSKDGNVSHCIDNVAICTIISKNYLAYARVLAESFFRYNKGKVFVLLTDSVDGYFDPKEENFTLIEIDAIKDKIKDFDRFCFQYNATELNTAVKPFFLEFLFEKYHIQKLIFFDPDILINNNLIDLLRLLDKFSIILTPHITQPFRDNQKPTEINILKSGIYNLGFIALSNKHSTKLLLKWWKERLSFYCKVDIQEGLFVDQKWIDLSPGFFDDVFILKDESYNVAYWNFHYRKVHIEGANILVNNTPSHFLHFSGFDPEDINSVSKHQDRFKLKDLNDMKPIFAMYRDKLIANGYSGSKDWPCIFNCFENGVKIPDIAKKIYWETNDQIKKEFGNPFNTSGKNSYFAWLNKNIDTKKPKITRLMYEIYKKRVDVQRIYADIFGSERGVFVKWFLIAAKREYGLDDLFLEDIISYNGKEEKFSFVDSKLKILYRVRSFARKYLKMIFKNNLKMMSNLRILELCLYKRIEDFSHPLSKEANYLKDNNHKKGVNVLGYLSAELGVGEGARANIKCLKRIGVDTSLINVNPSYSRQDDLSFSDFSLHNPYYINLIHLNADMLPQLYAEKGMAYFKNKYNIGFWTWELSDFPDRWLESFNYCNEVWVPSSFVQISIAKKSHIPVLKIPHAVALDKIKDVDRSYFGLHDNEFIFLFVFDFLSYFERKNPLAIIEAFKKTFSPSEEARLVIKCCNPSFNPQAMESLREAAKNSNIDIIDRYLCRDDVNALISLCDAYVSLHRSEGFGLTLAEAMYLGKPVIATAYSGNCDFMNINNSYLVKYKLAEINKDIGPYKSGCLWAEPCIEHAAEFMRYVYKNRKDSEKLGRSASEDIRANFNYNVIGNEIKNRIDYISRSDIRKS